MRWWKEQRPPTHNSRSSNPKTCVWVTNRSSSCLVGFTNRRCNWGKRNCSHYWRRLVTSCELPAGKNEGDLQFGHSRVGIFAEWRHSVDCRRFWTVNKEQFQFIKIDVESKPNRKLALRAKKTFALGPRAIKTCKWSLHGFGLEIGTLPLTNPKVFTQATSSSRTQEGTRSMIPLARH